MEVVFKILKICFRLHLSNPKNVTKYDLLISSYLGHRPVGLSSMEVVLQIFKNVKIVLGSNGHVLQMLQSLLC
jgi:hypothetical protein